MKKAKSPASQQERPLHLSKFTPARPGKRQPEISADQGQTMMIRRIAAETADRNLTESQRETDEFGLPVKEMLGVISHCYARGLFCSKDIAEALKEEPDLRNAIGRKLPNEETIRRFRRRHAAEIEETLENLYRVFPAEPSSKSSSPSASE